MVEELEIKLLYYLFIMENHMEKQMDNEMESGGIWRLRELKLTYHIVGVYTYIEMYRK